MKAMTREKGKGQGNTPNSKGYISEMAIGVLDGKPQIDSRIDN